MGKLKLSIIKDSSIVLFSDNTETKQSYVDIVIGDKSYRFKLTVKKLDFHKKIYQPGEIELVLQLTMPSGFNDFIPPESISSIFRNASVSLVTSSDESIAQNYYVQEIVPRYFATGTAIEITLRIFSLDYKLTLDKYCKAYTAKKLREDILCKDTDKLLSKSGIQIAKDDRLFFLGYKSIKEEEKDTPKENHEDNPKGDKEDYLEDKQIIYNELIQPYLVQYNESFYDFLVRTANRCGEFFYFEDGSLHLGLPPQTVEKEIKSYQSISYQSISDNVVETEDFYHNALSLDEKGIRASRNFIYNSDISTDEYIYSFERNEFTDDFKEWVGDWGSKILSWLSMALNNPSSIVDMAVQFGLGTAEMIYNSKGKADEINAKQNSKYIDSMKNEQKSADKNAQEASPFSTFMREEDRKINFKENLNTLFYSLVKQAESEVSRQAVFIDLGVNYADVKLGDIVSFAHDNSKKKYVVVEMSGMNYVSDSVNKIGYHLVLLPIYILKDKENTQNSLLLTCPPLCSNDKIRKSSPQIAIVAETNDVKGWGRIRIRYPWQQDSDDMSPWIRMASPFATDGGGIYFQPKEGDEVLVDYENGNIERPYVLGALYTGKVPVPGGDRIISSSNGHSIKMNDPEGSNEFFENLWGGASMLQGIIPPLENPYLEDQRGLAGGMELTDRYGIYSISMSSSDRSISIDSPFGNVSINAFSGISLSAPNGKIVLEAKDIEISAGNTISLTSGSNIPDVLTEMELKDSTANTQSQMSKWERVKQFFANKIMDNYQKLAEDTLGSTVIGNKLIGPFVDMKLLRNILEAFIKPSAGTLSIKSWRFMQLEAGRGEARIPNNGYTVSGLKYTTGNEHELLIKEYETIGKLESIVDTWFENLKALYENACSARETYQRALRDHTKQNANTDWEEVSANNAVNNFVKEAFGNSGVLKKYGKTDFLFKDALEKGNVIQVINAANALTYAVKEFADYIKEPQKKLFNSFAVFFNQDQKIFSRTVANACLSYDFFDNNSPVKNADNPFATPASTTTNTVDKKFWKRKLIHSYLNESEILEATPVANVDDLKNEGHWINYINTLKKRGKKNYTELTKSDLGNIARNSLAGILQGVEDATMNALAFPNWYNTKDLWGPESAGEILFSDKNGNTISFINGHLTHVKNDSERAYLEHIRAAMMKVN